MKTILKIRFYLIVLLSLLFSQCKKDPVKTLYFNFSEVKGVFITNEGNYLSGNASLSFYDYSSRRVYNNIFMARNGVPLGDVCQSMVIHNGLGYTVVNNSGKIEVIDVNTAESKGTISGFTSPRYIHFLNDDKAYVSDLYAKYISVVNPQTLKITGKINIDNHASAPLVQHTTEQMVQYGNYLFTNCWSFDNKILVIDTENDKLLDSIEVPVQPASLVLDKNNKLWTLTDGGFQGNPVGYEAASLVKIDAATLKIEATYHFNMDDKPSRLCLNNSRDTLYYLNNGVWQMPVSKEFQSAKKIIPEKSRLFYALAIEPETSQIFVSDAIDYQQNGQIYIYSSGGEPVDSFKVGIIPGSFCFK